MQEDPRIAADAMAQRLMILEAMAAVIDRRSEFMELVGSAADADAARRAASERFGLTEVQAGSVLDLQMRRFCEQEADRIREEADELRRLSGE